MENPVVTNQAAGNNGDELAYRQQLSKGLFWVAAFCTIFYMFFPIAQTFGFGAMTSEMSYAYLIVLATYSIYNTAATWKRNHQRRRGQYFAFAYIVYYVFVRFLQIIGVGIVSSDQLFPIFEGVIAIFFGTSITKIVKTVLNEK